MVKYLDPITGYKVRRYTDGPERNAKLYFTCENFSVDDKYFFFTKDAVDGKDGGVYRANVETGEMVRVADETYNGFATDREKNIGYICKNNTEVYTVDLDTLEMEKFGDLPKGGQLTGHLTASNTGRVGVSFQQASKIYALVTLDKGQEPNIAYQTDMRLGHSQMCPSDENLMFFVYETGGDAFQRTWMCDIKEHYIRPYYVEHPNEWITHEVWSADGSEMLIMKLPRWVIVGDKDGRHFDVVADYKQMLHPCLSRDKKWICADIIGYHGATDFKEGIVLIERATGKVKFIASCGKCFGSADHQHPSFNRAGTQILFNNPGEDGVAQVCVIDLDQIKKDW